VSCQACRLGPRDTRRGYCDWNTVYSTPGYMEHFQKCEMSQRGRAGVLGILILPVEISVFLMLDSWHFSATSNFETTILSQPYQSWFLEKMPNCACTFLNYVYTGASACYSDIIGPLFKRILAVFSTADVKLQQFPKQEVYALLQQISTSAPN
jgi:hypothetical protein